MHPMIRLNRATTELCPKDSLGTCCSDDVEPSRDILGGVPTRCEGESALPPAPPPPVPALPPADCAPSGDDGCCPDCVAAIALAAAAATTAAAAGLSVPGTRCMPVGPSSDAAPAATAPVADGPCIEPSLSLGVNTEGLLLLLPATRMACKELPKLALLAKPAALPDVAADLNRPPRIRA